MLRARCIFSSLSCPLLPPVSPPPRAHRPPPLPLCPRANARLRRGSRGRREWAGGGNGTRSGETGRAKKGVGWCVVVVHLLPQLASLLSLFPLISACVRHKKFTSAQRALTCAQRALAHNNQSSTPPHDAPENKQTNKHDNKPPRAGKRKAVRPHSRQGKPAAACARAGALPPFWLPSFCVARRSQTNKQPTQDSAALAVGALVPPADSFDDGTRGRFKTVVLPTDHCKNKHAETNIGVQSSFRSGGNKGCCCCCVLVSKAPRLAFSGPL